MAEQVAACEDEETRMELEFELAELYKNAAQLELSLQVWSSLRAQIPSEPQILMGIADVLTKMGRGDEIDAMAAQAAQRFGLNKQVSQTREYQPPPPCHPPYPTPTTAPPVGEAPREALQGLQQGSSQTWGRGGGSAKAGGVRAVDLGRRRACVDAQCDLQIHLERPEAKHAVHPRAGADNVA